MKTKKELVSWLKKYVKRNKFDIHCMEWSDMVSLSLDLEYAGFTKISVEEVSNENDSNLQAIYYSNKLGKTIIWEYDFDFNEDGENIELMAESILKLGQEVEDFENSISIIK